MPPGPFDADLNKHARKQLARRLRALIERRPLDVREMAAGLEVEPELVVTALRELRARRRGRLHSTIRLGHVAWWWEPTTTAKMPGALSTTAVGEYAPPGEYAPATDDPTAATSEPSTKKRHGGKKKRDGKKKRKAKAGAAAGPPAEADKQPDKKKKGKRKQAQRPAPAE